MVILEDLKDLVLYKKNFMMPIDQKDKKHNAMIMLLTPNYQSSSDTMQLPYLNNMNRLYESYYLEKSIDAYIQKNGKVSFVSEDYQTNIYEKELSENTLNIRSMFTEEDQLEDEDDELEYVDLSDEDDEIITEASNKDLIEYSLFYFNEKKDLFVIRDKSLYDIPSARYENKDNPVGQLFKLGMGSPKDGETKIMDEFVYGDKSGTIIHNSSYIYQSKIDTISKVHPKGEFISLKELSSKGTKNLSKHIIRLLAISGISKKYTAEMFLDTNIRYNGYKDDIVEVKNYINANSLEKVFKKCDISYKINNPITVIISRKDDDFAYMDKYNLTVLSKSAFEHLKNGYDYSDYIKVMITMYAYNTINEEVLDSILDPLSGYMSGVLDTILDKIDSGDLYTGSKYKMEMVFRYIHRKYGNKELIKIVKNNDRFLVNKYIYEIFKNKQNSSYFNNSLQQDFIMESDETAKIPSLDDLSKLGSKIKRRIRAASVYKLNKIKRDTASGNTGKEVRDGSKTDLEKIKNNDIVSDNTSTTSEVKEEYSVNLYDNINAVRIENNLIIHEADNTNLYLKNILYEERIRSISEIIIKYENIKKDIDFIRYTFLEVSKYNRKNLFFDFYYYNEVFFRNISKYSNMFGSSNNVSIKAVDLYLELLSRFIHPGSRFNSYKKKTIFIPVLDWSSNDRPWFYRNSLNPISVIYELLKNHPNKLLNTFGDIDIVFMGPNVYFKTNFNKDNLYKDKGNTLYKFRTLIERIVDLGSNEIPNDLEDDISINNIENKKSIALGIINKIEKSQNIEINNISNILKMKDTSLEPLKLHRVMVGGEEDPIKLSDKEKLVQKIVSVASTADTEDKALDLLDDDDEFRKILEILYSESPKNVNIDKTRASRMLELQKNFEQGKVDGKSIRDLLNENPDEKELPVTKLELSSPNEEWKNLTFTNFDTVYDPDSDIVKMLNAMQKWTYPVAVRNITVTDNSSSQDLLKLWTVECENYKGTRFTLKLDVPQFIDHRFLLLRGNKKNLAIQSTLIPILKTDLNTCQVIGVGGYNKVFVSLFNNNLGKSSPDAARFLKFMEKILAAKTFDIKVIRGNNEKICNKYELPIDYIDISREYSEIYNDKFTIILNQDELRSRYEIDNKEGFAIGYDKLRKQVIYLSTNSTTSLVKDINFTIINRMYEEGPKTDDLYVIYESINTSGKKYAYSRAKILGNNIPVILICAYLEGLIPILKKANVNFHILPKLTKHDRFRYDYIKFNDAYLVYDSSYEASILLNGLKECPTDQYSISMVNDREMYLEMLENFGGLIMSDGLENYYDLLLDPITLEILEMYKLPTDFVSAILYSSALLADNKYIRHTDESVRRFRRKELIAGYFYKALCLSYQQYANQIRHTRKAVKMVVKQSAIIDMLLSKDPSTSDLSINNVINDVESANTVTNKGLVGMNMDRSYSLDKRGYDKSMLNVLGMSTGFSGTVGINRQATINSGIRGARGFIKNIEGDASKLNSVDSLTITEAMIPFGTTHDDPFRTLMNFVQTSKHMMRTTQSDPMLITNGADEALAYLCSDIFAFKAKANGVIEEINEEKQYMIIKYDNGTYDYVDLSEKVEKNSDGGYSVVVKLDTDLKVGAKVKPGKILAYDKLSFSNSLGESDNIATNAGTLAKIAMLNTDEGFEDSALVTNEFAKKLSTEVVIEIDVTLDKDSHIILLKNVGDNILEGDTLLTHQTSFDDETSNALLRNLTIDVDTLSELGRNPVKSKYTGILQDIKVLRTCDLNDMSPSLKKFVKSYENKIKSKKNKLIELGLESQAATLPSTEKLDMVGQTKNVVDGVKIIFCVKYIDEVAIGDKIVFYSANKGIVKYITPEGEFPTSSFRPNEAIDAYVSIGSVNGRMVCSTPEVLALSKLMVELDRSIKDIVGIEYDDSKI